jgi:lipoprotein NlpI
VNERLDKLMKLYEADPNDPFVTYGIAMEHSKASDEVATIQWLDKTLALDDAYFYAYYQKALALGRQGDREKAKAVAQQGMTKAQSAGDAKATAELQDLLETL